ncbi:MAG TPA: hypothetical protein VLQ66_10820 [Paenisporosarcina sp.]|nr:hypothetical protein [Paenisporosarcina sp.]
MEVIIFAIITFIISAIAKRKNPNDDGGKTKPFMPNQQNQQKMKKLEDYAKEIYGDVQKQISERQSPRTNSKPDVISQMEQVKNSPSIQQLKDDQRAARRPGRLSTHQSAVAVSRESTDPESLVPTTESQLRQAIIFSEILAPPKSKR